MSIIVFVIVGYVLVRVFFFYDLYSFCFIFKNVASFFDLDLTLNTHEIQFFFVFLALYRFCTNDVNE